MLFEKRPVFSVKNWRGPGPVQVLCGRVAPLTQLWPRQKPHIDQRRSLPLLPKITASIIYFFRRFTALIA